MRKLTTQEFIQNATAVHGALYDYSKSIYQGSNKHIIIVCYTHGPFKQCPADHISQQQGCPKCGKQNMASKKRTTNLDFIKKSRQIHGKKYDYSKVNYTNTHTKVMITCPLHGDFLQKPNSHISGRNGCKKCAYTKHNGRYFHWHFNTKLERNKAGIFYVIKFTGFGEEFIKIGITSMPRIELRYSGRKFGYQMEILKVETTTLYKAFLKEDCIKNSFVHLRFEPSKFKEGRTECFTLELLQHINQG